MRARLDRWLHGGHFAAYKASLRLFKRL
jgi:hypothetical protein